MPLEILELVRQFLTLLLILEFVLEMLLIVREIPELVGLLLMHRPLFVVKRSLLERIYVVQDLEQFLRLVILLLVSVLMLELLVIVRVHQLILLVFVLDLALILFGILELVRQFLMLLLTLEFVLGMLLIVFVLLLATLMPHVNLLVNIYANALEIGSLAPIKLVPPVSLLAPIVAVANSKWK